MQFVKDYVPDKRWQTGQRPILVESNFFSWVFWKIMSGFETFFRRIRIIIEKTFKVLDNIKEENNEQQ